MSRKLVFIFSICIAILVSRSVQPQNIKRFGKFLIISDTTCQTERFTIRQFNYVTKIYCTQLCFQTPHCLSVTFVSKVCTLYSYDPRIKIETSLQNDASAIMQSPLYGLSQTTDKMSCFVDQSKVNNRSEIEQKCELGDKIIDSQCGEWSSWIPVYNPEVCPDTKLFSAKNRTRSCSHGLNGGLNCSQNIFEERHKRPLLFNSGETNLNYTDSREYCIRRGLSLFTNIALITDEHSTLISEADLTKLHNWYYFIDARPTNGKKFTIENDGTAEEYFSFCRSLEIVTGWANDFNSQL